MIMLNTNGQVITDNEETVSDTADESDNEESLISNTNSDTKQSRSDTDNDSENKTDSNNEENDLDSNDEMNTITNKGWADSVAKILKTNKPKGKKTLVLSKAKKLADVKKSNIKAAGFEVECKDGLVKQEQIIETIEEKLKSDEPVRKKKRELPNLRKKPDILEKDRERTLAKIATKGVVQLFNAVKTQQKDIKTKLQEAGPLEIKRDKVLKNVDKRAFLDVLMGEKSQAVDKTNNIEVNGKSKIGTTWSVLRDDFMMGAKLKDWDKELEEEEMEQEKNIESD